MTLKVWIEWFDLKTEIEGWGGKVLYRDLQDIETQVNN